MNAPNNSWQEWINMRYAMSFNEELIQYAIKHNKDCDAALFDAVFHDFHHGITPETRRMESPLF